MKIHTEGTLPGLNPLASPLACIFFFDENTYFNIDDINVEGKAYNFVKLIQGTDTYLKNLYTGRSKIDAFCFPRNSQNEFGDRRNFLKYVIF